MNTERSNFLIPGSIVVAGVIIALAVLYVGGAGREGGTTATVGGNTTQNSNAGTPSSDLLEDGDDPVIGNPEAPVTIVEFSDFQCPFCQRFWQSTLPEIREKYIKTGKVRFVYRDFPITTIHSEAATAAEAANCAAEQGKFWEYHDLIFGDQQSLGDASYRRWAATLGLDTARFNQCLDSGKYAPEVERDFNDGQQAGVSGTPTFFINGRAVVGALPFSQFESVIEAALAKQ